MIPNRVSGDLREMHVLHYLQTLYPYARIVRERFLRDSNGISLRDPITNQRRRIDFAVIRNDKIVDLIEVTNLTTDKTKQVEKEERIRCISDVYIKDPMTQRLLNITQVETRRIDYTLCEHGNPESSVFSVMPRKHYKIRSTEIRGHFCL